MDSLLSLPLTAQVGLGAGYLAYLLAYGADRKNHSTADTAFLSFAFGIPALIPMTLTPLSPLSSTLFGTAAALGLALMWQAGLQKWLLPLQIRLGLGREDGLPTAWSGVLAHPNLECSQISVHTTDGRVLYLNDRHQVLNAPHQGLYLGSDGSVLMAVQQEELPSGAEEQREDIIDPNWGARMTYIPAAQIVRINIRF